MNPFRKLWRAVDRLAEAINGLADTAAETNETARASLGYSGHSETPVVAVTVRGFTAEQDSALLDDEPTGPPVAATNGNGNHKAKASSRK